MAFFLADRPVLGIENCLVIYGSDRLGTIYGLFHLSEILGVSPCHYWGDVKALLMKKYFYAVQKTKRNYRIRKSSCVCQCRNNLGFPKSRL